MARTILTFSCDIAHAVSRGVLTRRKGRGVSRAMDTCHGASARADLDLIRGRAAAVQADVRCGDLGSVLSPLSGRGVVHIPAPAPLAAAPGDPSPRGLAGAGSLGAGGFRACLDAVCARCRAYR